MILSIVFGKLRNSEFIQFFVDLISIFKKFDLKLLGISEQLSPVEKDLALISAIHSTLKGSDISDELKALDDSRDDCIKGIRTVLEGYTYHWDAAIKTAAETLLNKIDSYGTGIAKQNYPTETTSLKGITDAALNEDKFKNAALVLNMTAWFGEMQNINNKFNQRYLDRVDENSKQTDDKIKELRKTTIEKYFELREHFLAHALLDKNENFKLLADQLNVLIEKYNNIIKRRGNNKGGDSEK